MTDLPFSQASENNREPILAVLRHALAERRHVLEIGSGTGQHSVHFAPQLPQLVWQTSELPEHHAGIQAWHAAHPAPNLRAPVALDLRQPQWPDVAASDAPIDAIFSANTLHIVAWPLVEQLFALAGQHLPAQGVLAVYGPFNYRGQFTSDSNRAFDAWLRARDANSGIRHIEDIQALAQRHGLQLLQDHAMPANNRTLVFQRP